MQTQDTERTSAAFELGQRLGECLVRGCVVFTGTIQSLGPLHPEPGESDPERAVMIRTVDLKVGEWLHGQASGDRVQLTAALPPELTKTNDGPWRAWEGVDLRPGAALLVVRWNADAPRATWMGQPEDIALVVSDTSVFPDIRAAIAQHRRFGGEPDEALNAPQRLRENPSVLYQAYVLTYLTEGESTRDVDRAGRVLSEVLSHDALPAAANALVAEWLATTFYRFSGPTRKAVTEALVASASADNAILAAFALSALITLGDLQFLDMKPALTPARQRSLIENYRSLAARTQVRQAHPEFESQLGIR